MLIFTYDPDLKPLLFLDLFTDEKGHYHEILNQLTSIDNKIWEETYEKYIKQRLINYDP